MLVIILITLQVITLPGSFHELRTSNYLPLPQKQTSLPPACTDFTSKEITSDNWKQTLESIRKSEVAGDCIHPEIAFELIKQVVNHNATPHFALAESLYYNALDAESSNTQSDLIAREAEKVLPLLSREEEEIWENKLARGDPSLAQDLKMFWKLRDPVLSTATNERLIEHWNRIGYARKTFTKNNESIYDTDDRGTIYVKYGKPSFKRTGTLSLSNTEIRSMLYDLSFHKGGISPREMFNLNMAIKQHYMPRYYEVWVYRNMDTRHPTLFIFGESAERGSFGLRNSVEEFISRDAFRMGITSSWRYDTGARGLSAGPFLQMSLYNQLSTIDIYFGSQLSEYDQNWLKYLNGHFDFSSLKMLNNRRQAERELRIIQEEAPNTRSTLQRNLDFVDHTYKTYRFINDMNEPVTKIFISSKPDKELLDKHTQIFQHQNPRYKIKQTAALLDRSGNTIYSDHKKTALESNYESASSTATMLEVPIGGFSNLPENLRLILSSEINQKPSGNNIPATVVASTTDTPDEVPPLDTDFKKLEVSDLIWGYKDTQKDNPVEGLEFFIPSDNRIPQGKNFAMYFEAYHLSGTPDSLFNYQMEYSIHRVKRKRLIDTGIKLTLNFSSRQTTSKEALEVKTSNLEEGTYRITCTFKPLRGAEPVARTVEFEIFE